MVGGGVPLVAFRKLDHWGSLRGIGTMELVWDGTAFTLPPRPALCAPLFILSAPVPLRPRGSLVFLSMFTSLTHLSPSLQNKGLNLSSDPSASGAFSIALKVSDLRLCSCDRA